MSAFAFLLSFSLHVMAATNTSVFVGLEAPLPAALKQNEIFSFKPMTGHHFAEEAPQNCGQGQLLVSRDAQAVRCQFTATGQARPMFNVCDDKKTYCKPVRLTIDVAAQGPEVGEKLKKNQNLNHDLKVKLAPGFVMKSPEQLVKENGGRPILVMISTDWCPPCNEAKENLLPAQEFQQATAGWTKVYVDGDSLSAQEWEKVTPYKYYPTFILTNDRLKEVARYMGPLRQDEFLSWAKNASALIRDPIESLKVRALSKEQPTLLQKMKTALFKQNTEVATVAQRQRLLEWALAMEDEALILSLEKDTALTVDLEIKMLNFKARTQKGEEKVVSLKKLLDLTEARDSWTATLFELCEVDAKACEPYEKKLSRRFEFLAKQPWSESEKSSALAEESLYASKVYALLKRPADEARMTQSCVDNYKQMAKGSQLQVARSAHQGMMACLDSMASKKEALRVVDQLIASYPNEPTFLLKKARLLKKENKAAEALVWLTKAEAKAYGYNWFAVQAFKAELLLEQKKLPAARAVIDEALAQVQLDATKDSRNQQIAGRLRSLRLKAQSGVN